MMCVYHDVQFKIATPEGRQSLTDEGPGSRMWSPGRFEERVTTPRTGQKRKESIAKWITTVPLDGKEQLLTKDLTDGI